jgi:hypothetical protein
MLTTHHLVPRSRLCGVIHPFPQYVFMAWCLVKHRDNFTFTFTFTLKLGCGPDSTGSGEGPVTGTCENCKESSSYMVKVKLSLCFNWAPRHEGVLGEWMYSSTHSLTSALDGDEWSASRPGRLTPKERAPGTYWMGGWVGPRAVLDAVVKRKIPSPRRESNSRTPIVQPVAQRYTDWTITTRFELHERWDIWLADPLSASQDVFCSMDSEGVRFTGGEWESGQYSLSLEETVTLSGGEEWSTHSLWPVLPDVAIVTKEGQWWGCRPSGTVGISSR